MKYAPFYKRFQSSVIDLLILYSPFVTLVLLYNFKYTGFTLKVLFLLSIIYHFITYKKNNQTFGERFLKLELEFIDEIDTNNFRYFIRAFCISVVYFPYAISFHKEAVIGFVIGSILLQLFPEVRGKRQFMWDFVTKSVIVEKERY